jgi:4-hydroxy-4-methyl-2-oxoglutarate aldolase
LDALAEIDVDLTVGLEPIPPGDLVVLDADGVAVVEAERADEVLQASLEREQREAVKRERLQGGALSWHIDGLKEKWT